MKTQSNIKAKKATTNIDSKEVTALYKAQLKRLKEEIQENKGLSGNLSLLSSMYGTVLTVSQIALIDFMFTNKSFDLFKFVTHKRFKLRFNRETVTGYRLTLDEETFYGKFCEDLKSAKAEQDKQADNPANDSKFWKSLKPVQVSKTYDSLFSPVIVLQALQQIERALNESFSLSGFVDESGKIKATRPQIYRALGLDVPKPVKKSRAKKAKVAA